MRGMLKKIRFISCFATIGLLMAVNGVVVSQTTKEPLVPIDQLSIFSVEDLNARRKALVNKIWNRPSVDTVQGVDEDVPPETIDVQEDQPEIGDDFFRFSEGGGKVVTGYKDLYLLGSYGDLWRSNGPEGGW